MDQLYEFATLIKTEPSLSFTFEMYTAEAAKIRVTSLLSLSSEHDSSVGTTKTGLDLAYLISLCGQFFFVPTDFCLPTSLIPIVSNVRA